MPAIGSREYMGAARLFHRITRKTIFERLAEHPS
jgi:hypothetical protein